MTIIEAGGRAHGVVIYEVVEADDGETSLRFFADCGLAVDWPYPGVRNTSVAMVDCDDCIAAKLDAIRADMEAHGWTA